MEGDDITASVLAIGGIPLNLSQSRDGKRATPLCGKIELRGEIYMPLSRFSEINEARQENGAEQFKTPRNLAAGSVRFDDLEAVQERGLAIVLFSWGAWEPLPDEPLTQSDFVNRVGGWGIPVLELLDRIILSKGMIPQVRLEMYEEQLSTMDMPTDGLVLKIEDVSLRRKLGTGSRSPNWAIAYKFEPESATATVKAITFNIGRTGRLAPVAEFDPVEINGRSVSRASLHNLDTIHEMDLRQGDRVKVTLQGDVIPLVTAVLTEQRDPDSSPFMRPANCPGCGSKLPVSGKLRCKNPDCPEKRIKQLLYFAKSVGIRGIMESEVRSLFSSGKLVDASDFYNLWNPGEVPAWKILQGLGIEGMGPVSCRQLLDEVGTLHNLKESKWKPVDFLDIGLTRSQADSMTRFLEVEANLLLIGKLTAAQQRKLSSTVQEAAAHKTSRSTYPIPDRE
jgi:DNA ligase (NAD+)